MSQNIVDKELLDNPLFVRSLRDKLRIVNKCRPTPPLQNVIARHKTKTEPYTRKFCVSQYENFGWIAGYERASFIVALFTFT